MSSASLGRAISLSSAAVLSQHRTMVSSKMRALRPSLVPVNWVLSIWSLLTWEPIVQGTRASANRSTLSDVVPLQSIRYKDSACSPGGCKKDWRGSPAITFAFFSLNKINYRTIMHIWILIKYKYLNDPSYIWINDNPSLNKFVSIYYRFLVCRRILHCWLDLLERSVARCIQVVGSVTTQLAWTKNIYI